jgi:MFS family permease
VWAVPAFLFLVAFFHRAAPGVVAKELMQAFGATGAIVGFLSATYFYAYAALMIPAGVVIDRLGVRRVGAAGGTLMAAGTLLMAGAPGQGTLFAGRFLVGAGAAVTFVGALKIAASWFPPSYFGTLSAVTATIGVVGGLIGTAPLAWLAAALGWRRAFLVVALATLAGAALCLALVREHPREGGHAGPAPPTWRGVLLGLGRVLGNRHTWPPFFAFFFLLAASQNLQLWVVPYLRDVYGLGLAEAALHAAAWPLALLVAGPLTGYLSDRVLRRRKLPYTLLTAAQLAGWAVLVGTLGRLPLPGVYALLFGMGLVGGAFVLTWPIGREVNPPELAGMAVATVNLGGFVGIALTQGPLGALLDARWAGAVAEGARVYPVAAYRAAFLACVALLVCAVAMSLLLQETRGRNVFGDR